MSNVNADNFALPVLDNTFSVVQSKAKIPTLKKIGGVDKLIDTEEYLGIEAMESTIIDWLGDKNARKIGVLPTTNEVVKIYGLGLAGIVSSRFHLCDLGMAQQRVIVSFKRKKLASKYPASEIEKVLPKLVFQAVSSWPDAIIYGGFPIHFGVLSRILLSPEYQEVIRKTKFSYETLNVLEPCSTTEFWYQVYATHFSLANRLKELNHPAQAQQVMQQLQITLNESTYQQAVIAAFGEPDLTKVFDNMSKLFLEREKTENKLELVEHLPSEVNPVNKPDLGEFKLEASLNIELIQELKSNPTPLDKLNTPSQIDDFCIKLGGKDWLASSYLHTNLPEGENDPGETKLKDKKLIIRKFIESYSTETTEQ